MTHIATLNVQKGQDVIMYEAGSIIVYTDGSKSYNGVAFGVSVTPYIDYGTEHEPVIPHFFGGRIHDNMTIQAAEALAILYGIHEAYAQYMSNGLPCFLEHGIGCNCNRGFMDPCNITVRSDALSVLEMISNMYESGDQFYYECTCPISRKKFNSSGQCFHCRGRFRTQARGQIWDIVWKIVEWCYEHDDITIRLEYVRSHVGEEGNELADRVAKEAAVLQFVGAVEEDMCKTFGIKISN